MFIISSNFGKNKQLTTKKSEEKKIQKPKNLEKRKLKHQAVASVKQQILITLQVQTQATP